MPVIFSYAPRRPSVCAQVSSRPNSVTMNLGMRASRNRARSSSDGDFDVKTANTARAQHSRAHEVVAHPAAATRNPAREDNWKGGTYDLLAHPAIIRDFLALRAAKLLRAGCERLVEIVLLATGSGVVVRVVHLGLCRV